MEKRFKVYENKEKFDIYSAYGQFIVSCTNRQTADYLLKKLEENKKIYEEKVKGQR